MNIILPLVTFFIVGFIWSIVQWTLRVKQCAANITALEQSGQPLFRSVKIIAEEERMTPQKNIGIIQFWIFFWPLHLVYILLKPICIGIFVLPRIFTTISLNEKKKLVRLTPPCENPQESV
jgi:hypothetical protein